MWRNSGHRSRTNLDLRAPLRGRTHDDIRLFRGALLNGGTAGVFRLLQSDGRFVHAATPPRPFWSHTSERGRWHATDLLATTRMQLFFPYEPHGPEQLWPMHACRGRTADRVPNVLRRAPCLGTTSPICLFRSATRLIAAASFIVVSRTTLLPTTGMEPPCPHNDSAAQPRAARDKFNQDARPRRADRRLQRRVRPLLASL